MITAPKPATEERRLAALHSYSVLDTLSEAAYDDVALIAAEICETPIALISLVDAERQWFKAKIGLEVDETSRDVAFCAHAILDPTEVFTVPDAALDERFRDNPLVVADPSIRFYAGAPLVTSEGDALGTLCVIDRVPRELSARDEAALMALARQVVHLLELRKAVANLEYAAEARVGYEERLEEYQEELTLALLQISEQSRTDTLTGVRNRLEFTEIITAEAQRFDRYGTPVSIAMIDVDEFKTINDRFGHPAGDAVLREIARILGNRLRGLDTIARYGGDEFVLVLPNTDLAGARVVAERCRREIEENPWTRGPVTISVGVASLGDGANDVDELIATADRGLYRAKERGRNQVG